MSSSKTTISQKEKCVQEKRICEDGAKDEGKYAKSEAEGEKKN